MGDVVQTVDLTHNLLAPTWLRRAKTCLSCRGRGTTTVSINTIAYTNKIEQPCAACCGLGVAVWFSWN